MIISIPNFREKQTNLFNREPESVVVMNPKVALKGHVSMLRYRPARQVRTS